MLFRSKISPKSDIEVIHTELALSDLETVDRALLRSNKQAKSGDKTAAAESALLEKVKIELNQGKPARSLKFRTCRRLMTFFSHG